jgi:hypothetical protein
MTAGFAGKRACRQEGHESGKRAATRQVREPSRYQQRQYECPDVGSDLPLRGPLAAAAALLPTAFLPTKSALV